MTRRDYSLIEALEAFVPLGNKPCWSRDRLLLCVFRIRATLVSPFSLRTIKLCWSGVCILAASPRMLADGFLGLCILLVGLRCRMDSNDIT